MSRDNVVKSKEHKGGPRDQQEVDGEWGVDHMGHDEGYVRLHEGREASNSNGLLDKASSSKKFFKIVFGDNNSTIQKLKCHNVG